MTNKKTPRWKEIQPTRRFLFFFQNFSCFEKSSFLVPRGDELNPYGQILAFFFNGAKRDGDRGDSGKVYRHGINILEIHRKRIRNFLPYFKRGVRRRRGLKQINIFKFVFKIFSYHISNFLRPGVIGVVISGRKDVGA